jgi:hypothetical protein
MTALSQGVPVTLVMDLLSQPDSEAILRAEPPPPEQWWMPAGQSRTDRGTD